MKLKLILTSLLTFTLFLGVSFSASHVEARAFSGGSHSSYHSSVKSKSSWSNSSSSGLSKSSKKSSWFGGSSKKSSSSSKSKSKISLSKKSKDKSKSKSNKAFSGKTSKKSKSSTSDKKKSAFSGKTSTKKKSVIRGKTYKGKATTARVNGRNVSVNNYYHAGYSPSGWFGYYNGFTTGMFMTSMMHPWGYVYPIGGSYVSYGHSPLAWIADIIALIIVLIMLVMIYRMFRPKKHRRRF
ncbi:hypothetical protein P4393_12385 [Bacillus subtilis]|nr:hypothetical protein [Bacillus subtilis]MED3474625.1 hypothetical protein [Bacillus subtilis]